MLIQRRTEYSQASSSPDPLLLTAPRQTPHPDLKSTTLRRNDQESQFYVAIRGLQGELRRKQLADPNSSQSHIFRFCAPLAVFLYFFTVGMTVPRNSTAIAYVTILIRSLGSFGILVALSVVGVGAVFVLVILWALIWPLAKVLRSFCEWDVMELNGMNTNQSSEYEFSQANMLFGWLLT